MVSPIRNIISAQLRTLPTRYLSENSLQYIIHPAVGTLNYSGHATTNVIDTEYEPSVKIPASPPHPPAAERNHLVSPLPQPPGVLS